MPMNRSTSVASPIKYRIVAGFDGITIAAKTSTTYPTSGNAIYKSQSFIGVILLGIFLIF
jgi:hypothetical protein